MKIITFATLIVIIGFIPLSAHPASQVTLSYDQETQILRVDFEHKVSNALVHFINKIEVKLNDNIIIEQKIDIQDTKDGGTFIYKVPGLEPGDKISVTTECNKNGKKSAELEIE